MTTAEQWACRVIEWQASGESAEQFAQRFKCKPEALKRWKRQAARKQAQWEQEVRLVPVVQQEPEPAPEQELPVDPQPPPAVRPAEQGLVVELSCGSRVRVHRGFDAVLLRQLIVQATVPQEIIDRGLPTADLLSHIIVSKFADKLPYNRQESMYKREAVTVTRSATCQWTGQAHELASPLVKAMADDARSHADVISTDSTGTLVQANERCKKGYFWV